jgi:aryl-alcohol dehydrogenase-like predicted oxidoreductase
MKTRTLGSAGPDITVIGLGAWAIGGPWKFGWGPVDDEESEATIRHAVDLGVNWIDTAAVYGLGHSEKVIGRALAPYSVGEDVLVFTKCGRLWNEAGEPSSNLRPESIRRECEASLRRLQLERIDLYQIHWPDLVTDTPVEDSWATLAELADEGKVRWLGVCNFDVPLLERIEPIRHVDSIQPQLSLLARGALPEIVPWARDNGTGVIAYSPMASGMLTGAFDRSRLDRLDPDDWRRRSPVFNEPMLSRNLDLVERLRPLVRRLDTTIPALAIAWVLAQEGVTGAIAGARLPHQVDGWLAGESVDLSDDALAEINGLIAETGAGTDELPQPPPASAAGARQDL